MDRPSMLHQLEANLVGDVMGRMLLHLQCHFGMDTIRWARRGARATGIDFSSAAIEAARRLAAEMGVPATFLESDVYALPD
ncbi:MAG TPA: class I SAM-dependent methyltransferase, partial [Pseudomonadales bacterium]|nr:class I SAM-dependent methyltransferase [Pseudomonadales bacterium]